MRKKAAYVGCDGRPQGRENNEEQGENKIRQTEEKKKRIIIWSKKKVLKFNPVNITFAGNQWNMFNYQ